MASALLCPKRGVLRYSLFLPALPRTRTPHSARGTFRCGTLTSCPSQRICLNTMVASKRWRSDGYEKEVEGQPSATEESKAGREAPLASSGEAGSSLDSATTAPLNSSSTSSAGAAAASSAGRNSAGDGGKRRQTTKGSKKKKKRAKNRQGVETWNEMISPWCKSYQRTAESVPKADENGLVLCFSQGNTDYCWKEVKPNSGVKQPTVLRGETTYNRVRFFGMPKGYPDTTAVGFRRFFYLSIISSFVSNFASSIGFQSLLNGFFLGSSPQLWMLKDLIPALLAAYLANRVVSYENRPKFWFVVSVLMNNLSVISDMMIPWLLPNHLLAAAVTTSTVKQSSALMFMVSRAAALQHFATNNNLAELTKKFNSFGMVSYTVATALGIAFCTLVTNFTVQLVTVVVCCAINMLLAPMAVNPISFRILNFNTMVVIMQHYVNKRVVINPDQVSELLGTRMIPKLSPEEQERDGLLYISPPLDKLLIRSDTLDEDVLYVDRKGTFMLGLWRPSAVPLTVRECWQRYELPSMLRAVLRLCSPWHWFRPKTNSLVEGCFRGRRLVLFVHSKCGPADLVTAYLIMYSAVFRHSDSEKSLRSFVRRCHQEQELWHEEGKILHEGLRRADWDVELPAVDHPNFRLSELPVPPAMRAGVLPTTEDTAAPR